MRILNTTLVALLLLLLGVAVAQQIPDFDPKTPLNTEITNQASATFNDSSGVERTTTSNQVVTIVQQVHGIVLWPEIAVEADAGGQTRWGLPGGPVYFSYSLTNTGNGVDEVNLSTSEGGTDDFDFTSKSAYLDVNCNGRADAGEEDLLDEESPSLALAAGEAVCLVVEAVLPGGETDGSEGNLNLVATSANEATATDNSWAKAVASTGADFELALVGAPSGQVAPEDSITYTFSGTNVGGSAAYGFEVNEADGLGLSEGDELVPATGLLFVNELPANTTFSTFDAKATGAGATHWIYEAADGWHVFGDETGTPTATGITKVGVIIEGAGDFFAQDASFEFSYQVTVDAEIAVRQVTNDGGDLTYGATSETSTKTERSNTFTHRVDADSLYGFHFDAGVWNTTAATWESAFDDWSVTIDEDNATQTLDPTVHSGAEVLFSFTLENDGAYQDSYRLAIDDAAGLVCGFRQLDGVTPLTGTVGPLAPDEGFEFALACRVPADADAAATVIVSATSVERDALGAKTVANVVPMPTDGYDVAVGMENVTDVNVESYDPRDEEQYVQTFSLENAATPGGTLTVPLTVYHLGAQPDVYRVSATVPDGWSVELRPAGENNPSTHTKVLTAESNMQNFEAVIRVPADAREVELEEDGTTVKPYGFTFTAESTTRDDVKDELEGTLTVAAEYRLSLEPDRAGNITAPGTLTQEFNLRNLGNAPAYVDAEVVGGEWTYQISLDGGASWGADPDPVQVGVSGSDEPAHEVRVRVIVPAGQAIGAVETVTLTAWAGSEEEPSQSDATADQKDSVSITTTVVGGDLVLEKSAVTYECSDFDPSTNDVVDDCTIKDINGDGTLENAGEAAAPGDYIVYTLTGTNIGTADIRKVVILEPLPNFTEFVSISGTADDGSILFSKDFAGGSPTWDDDPSWGEGDFGSGQSVYAGLQTVVEVGTAVIDEDDVLAPAASFEIKFIVQVK